MTKRGRGRDQVHQAAWGESYPHPFISCLMPGIATLAVVAALLVGFQLWQMSLPGTTKIPSVVGMPVEDAKNELYRANLNVEIAGHQVASEEVPAGAVLSMDPEPPRDVKVGRIVRLVVSSGSAFTKVPDVRELSQSVARARLTAAELVIADEQYVFNSSIPYDRIISILPKPGTRLARMSTVALTISKGKKSAQPRDEDGAPIHSTVLTVDLPSDGAERADVRIDITDDDGTRTILQEPRNAGETLVQSVQGNGDTTVEVYYGDRKVLTRTF